MMLYRHLPYRISPNFEQHDFMYDAKYSQALESVSTAMIKLACLLMSRKCLHIKFNENLTDGTSQRPVTCIPT